MNHVVRSTGAEATTPTGREERLTATVATSSPEGTSLRRKAVIALAISASLGAVHVVYTALFLLPDNPLTPIYRPVVWRYMAPLFQQDWLLFAPKPAVQSSRLRYRVRAGGAWGPWRVPIEPLIVEHQRNRAGFGGRFLTMYATIGHHLVKAYSSLVNLPVCAPGTPGCAGQANVAVTRSEAFRTAAHLAVALESRYPHGVAAPDSLQLGILVVSPKPFSQRTNNHSGPKVDSVDFAPVTYPAPSVARRAR